MNEGDRIEVGPAPGWRLTFEKRHFRVVRNPTNWLRDEGDVGEVLALPVRAEGDDGPRLAVVRLRALVPPYTQPPPFEALKLAMEFGAIGVHCEPDEDHDFLSAWNHTDDDYDRVRAYVPAEVADAYAAAWRLLEGEG